MATQVAERLDDRSVSVFPRHAKPSPKITSDSDEIAVYLAKMTFELSAIARKANFDLLAYFLEMARIEANGQVAKSRGDLT
jgi:hypothetical protein